jgi:hypothetical protein
MNVSKFITLAAIVALSACNNVTSIGSGKEIQASDNIISRSVNVSGFDKIDASNSLHVIYTYGNDESVVVKASDNIIDYIEIKNKGGHLEIATKGNHSLSFSNSNLPVIYVTSPNVNEFEADANATIDIIGNPNGKDIELSASSNSTISAQDMTVQSASLDAGSNATINTGHISADKVDIESSSNAKINVSGIAANKLEVEASSNAKVNATDIKSQRLEAESSSNATITLAGASTSSTLSANSNGKINATDLKSDNISRDTSSNGSIKL